MNYCPYLEPIIVELFKNNPKTNPIIIPSRTFGPSKDIKSNITIETVTNDKIKDLASIDKQFIELFNIDFNIDKIQKYINKFYSEDEMILYKNFLNTYVNERQFLVAHPNLTSQAYINSLLEMISILQLKVALLYIDTSDKSFLLNYINSSRFFSGTNFTNNIKYYNLLINYIKSIMYTSNSKKVYPCNNNICDFY
jgi:hypothetical protein